MLVRCFQIKHTKAQGSIAIPKFTTVSRAKPYLIPYVEATVEHTIILWIFREKKTNYKKKKEKVD